MFKVVDWYLASSNSNPIDFLKNSLLETTKHSTFSGVPKRLKLCGDVGDVLGERTLSLIRGEERGEIDEDVGDANARPERDTE